MKKRIFFVEKKCMIFYRSKQMSSSNAVLKTAMERQAKILTDFLDSLEFLTLDQVAVALDRFRGAQTDVLLAYELWVATK
jgi:hypothetical protein